jgi:hypothetical protein
VYELTKTLNHLILSSSNCCLAAALQPVLKDPQGHFPAESLTPKQMKQNYCLHPPHNICLQALIWSIRVKHKGQALVSGTFTSEIVFSMEVFRI